MTQKAAGMSESNASPIERGLRSPRWIWVCALLAMALSVPALSLGYILDDKIHQAMIRPDIDFPEPTDPLWDLFAFMDGSRERNQTFMDHGIFPWWTEPTLRAQFLRPVTAATHLFDHWVAPGNPTFAHLQSLFWLAACVVLVGFLYRRWLGPTVTAGLATLLFALDDAHGMPVAWLANRNALIALAFGVAALLLHDEWQRRGRIWAGLAAPSCFVASLLSGEIGASTAAYFLAYALFFPEPIWRVSVIDRRRRVLSLAPVVLVGAVWKLAHTMGGYGASGSGLYLDPARSPMAFASAAALRVPVLLAGQWTPVPSDLAMLLSGPSRLLLAFGAVAASLFVARWAWRRASPHGPDRTAVAMLLTGTVLAAIPVAGAFPSNRLLAFLGIGGFGVVAIALRSSGLAGSGSRIEWGSGLMVLTHCVLAPVGLAMAPAVVHFVGETLPGRCARAVGPAAPIEGQTLVFINAHSLCGAYVAPTRALAGHTLPARVRVLASLFDALKVRRVDDRTLEVTVEAGMQRHPLDQLMRRPDHPVAVGESVAVTGMVARVVAHTDSGLMKIVRFTFDRPLEDPQFRFFVLDANRAHPFRLPPPGDTVTVEAAL